MTEDLVQQLLRRNHQLTSQVTAMDLKLKRLECEHQKIPELFQQSEKNHYSYLEMVDSYWEKTQILSLIVDWAVEKLGGDFDSFCDQAKSVVDKERLQMQFEEDTTDNVDGIT